MKSSSSTNVMPRPYSSHGGVHPFINMQSCKLQRQCDDGKSLLVLPLSTKQYSKLSTEALSSKAISHEQESEIEKTIPERANLSIKERSRDSHILLETHVLLSLIHICRCRRYAVCRSRWSPYH
eukprot:TRINITY_DN10791_c0_g2_i2.p2 TRINITY_DN10791_c0_g2~~TRINITY_DN10791_c0_g2_i2.p2  ORF type:complete len:124 (-),score=0.40 TRINITY_DN10791_c0_g2_i2:19-390(-)